jgi:hypothetical protein
MNTLYSKYCLILILTLFSSAAAHAASPTTKALSENTPPPPTITTAQQTSKKSATGSSVLDRFQSHSGPRSPAALSSLFTMPLPINIIQHPDIALSDGISTVTIETAFATPNNTVPNFACNGAQLISVKRNDTGAWVIMILPDKNSWNTSLIVLTGSVSLEIPLTVAPKLAAGTDLSKQGFISFLGSSKGPDSQPLLDLNGDGLYDYLDDYIFTANYLVKQRSMATAPDSNSKTEGQNQLNSQAPAETPGAGPGISPESGSTIKTETGYGRQNPANRNERARKMQELIKRPGQ